MKLTNILQGLRRDPVASAVAGLDAARMQLEAAREAMMKRASREERRGAALKARANSRFERAADSISAAQRAERVAERIAGILR